MDRKPEIQGVSIVFVGSLNPQIFQPAWFFAQGLIRQEEQESAKIEVILPALTSFSTDWLSIQVTPEKFIARTAYSRAYEWLRDLALGVFTLLPHTPLRQLGLNRQYHFRIESDDAWHNIGHRLSPKEPWEAILEQPGMKKLTIQGIRPDPYQGYINVSVEPSVKVRPGAYVDINDHYETTNKDDIVDCRELTTILEENWNISLKRSEEIAFSIASL